MSTILNEDNTNYTIIKILLWSVSRSYYGQYQDIVLTVIFKVDL